MMADVDNGYARLLPTPLVKAHVATLGLSHTAFGRGERAAWWQLHAAQVGVSAPLALVRDLGALLAEPTATLARPAHLPTDVDTGAYAELLAQIAGQPLPRATRSWGLSDAVTGVLLARLLNGVVFPARYALPGGAAGARWSRALAGGLVELPPAAAWAETPPVARPTVRDWLPSGAAARILANLRGLAVEEVRFLHQYGPRLAGAPEARALLDLYTLLGVPGGTRAALGAVLRLLPQVSAVRRASGAQTYTVGGYAGLTHQGSLDNLLPTEVGYPPVLFYHRVLNREALYYGREAEGEGRREAAYLLTQTGLEVAGDVDVALRAATLALAQVLQRRGYAVWQSFVGSTWTEPAGLAQPGEVARLLYYRDAGWAQPEAMAQATLAQVRCWGDRYRAQEVLWVVSETWDAETWETHAEVYRELGKRAGQQAWYVRGGAGNREHGDGSKGACFSRYQVLDAGALWEHAAPPPVELLPPPPRRAQREWERLKEDLEAPGFVGGARDVLHFADEERQLAAWSALASLIDDSEQAQIDAYLRELTPEGMVYIPAGPFLMGTTEAEITALLANTTNDTIRMLLQTESPQHEVLLGGYYIGRTPVTNEEYAAFVEATGYQTEAETDGGGWVIRNGRYQQVAGADWQHPDGPESSILGKETHPVVQVSWNDAVAYCAWRGGRLPTEAEWEKAAGWDAAANVQRRYPWGDVWDPEKCNINRPDDGTTPVGAYSPAGDSPYGCADMAGNVFAWCSTRWGTSAAQPDYRYPYVADDGREDPGGGREMLRIVRGTSWHTVVEPVRQWARCGYRYWHTPGNWYSALGFRLVAPRHLLVLESSEF
ncbi:MAG: formylglycine-generating enzyme family protein [Anaerolineae bacterium]|jgi:formylglycine-generating enzyme required for sulfatase activity|nr:formylglycine-generating enzyme family protein [Anaerolineae bacterium]